MEVLVTKVRLQFAPAIFVFTSANSHVSSPPLYLATPFFLFFYLILRTLSLYSSLPYAYTTRRGRGRLNMRRRPPYRGSRTSCSTCAEVRVSAFSGSISDFPVPLLHRPSAGLPPRPDLPNSRGDVCRRAVHHAIDAISQKFDEAQQEYLAVTPLSPEWYKWNGEMTAYANAVALLESLTSRVVLVP